jgi:hypothetical protein
LLKFLLGFVLIAGLWVTAQASQSVDNVYVTVSPIGDGSDVYVIWGRLPKIGVKSVWVSRSNVPNQVGKLLSRLKPDAPYYIDKLAENDKQRFWFYNVRIEYYGSCWFALSQENLNSTYGKTINKYIGDVVSEPTFSQPFFYYGSGSSYVKPPTFIRAKDKPNDKGDQIDVVWMPAKERISINFLQLFEKDKSKENVLIENIIGKLNEKAQGDKIEYYDLFRLNLETGQIDTVKRLQSFVTSYKDQRASYKDSVNKINGYIKMLAPQPRYEYYIRAGSSMYYSRAIKSNPVQAKSDWFDTEKLSVLIAMLLFTIILFYYLYRAKRDANLYIRPLAGLKEIDNAVGRATEMGRPILFVPGLSSINDVATIAGLNILSGVAKKAAEYDTPLFVPLRDYLVLPIAQEIVKNAYSEVGRPDAYKEESVFFVTTSQFAYVAGVGGLMAREKPATNFFMGMFWAESLILTEKGNEEGCIQIAGSDADAQLPFFITTCDFTLIGEELYAASAYISRNPLLLGSIKAQDLDKVFIIASIVIGAILTTLAGLMSYPAFNMFKEFFPTK